MTRYARRFGRALCAALLACAFSVAAAADAGTDRAALETGAPTQEPSSIAGSALLRSQATVVIFNRPIVTFRAPFLGVPPADRARGARERILALLEGGGPGAVSVEKLDAGDAVKIDGRLAFVLTRDDVDRLGGQTLGGLEADTLRALERVIAETREARNVRVMLLAALWAAGATIVYVLLLWGIARLGRAVAAGMLRVAESTAGQLKIGGAEIVHRERARRVVQRLLQLGFWAIVLLLTYEWVGFVLGRFPYTRPWGEQLNAFLFNTAVNLLTAVALATPDLLIAILIFAVAHGINGMLKNFFDGVQYGRLRVGWIDADSARPTRRLVAFGVWVFALVMAYPYIPGSSSEAFKGLSVLVGLMLSLGASGIVGQAASGLILMYTRTFRPGEYIRIAEHEGTIVEMGMFTTRLRTGLGDELTLPNSVVLGSVTRNYSRVLGGKGFVLHTAVTIGYDAPWRQVHAMLTEAARRTRGVVADPPPQVFQTTLSDFYVEYQLVCNAVQADPHPRAQVMSALHANVQDVFNEHGVQIMSPHYLGDPSEPKVVPKAKWYPPPAVPPEAGK
jgi:small-conductance mechanosensitive channel